MSIDHIWDWGSTILFCQKFQMRRTLLSVRTDRTIEVAWFDFYVEHIFTGLLAIRLLATYLSDPSTKEIALLQVREWLSDPSTVNSKTLRIMAATLFMHDDNCKEAMKAISSCSNMEQ